MDPIVWTPDRGDGATFVVRVRANGSEDTLFSQYIDPKNEPGDRRWHENSVDLSTYLGEPITVVLSTTFGENGLWDWAGWGGLRIVRLEASAGRSRRRAGISRERSASGGASALLAVSPNRSSFLVDAKPTLGQVYDGATMVLVELAFIMLWTGLVMGAIWADHSWGRPWGWDPKEVFALNTFIVLALLVPVRMKVRDKGLWTALLAIAGCGVMLFNVIASNFIIV